MARSAERPLGSGRHDAAEAPNARSTAVRYRCPVIATPCARYRRLDGASRGARRRRCLLTNASAPIGRLAPVTRQPLDSAGEAAGAPELPIGASATGRTLLDTGRQVPVSPERFGRGHHAIPLPAGHRLLRRHPDQCLQRDDGVEALRPRPGVVAIRCAGCRGVPRGGWCAGAPASRWRPPHPCTHREYGASTAGKGSSPPQARVCGVSAVSISYPGAPGNGAPGRIRTCDLRIRSPLLYPN